MSKTSLVIFILILECFFSFSIKADSAKGFSSEEAISSLSFKRRWQAESKGGVTAFSWSANGARLAFVDDGDRGNSVYDAITHQRISYWRSNCFLREVGIALMPDGQSAISCPQLEGEPHVPGVASLFDVDTGSIIKHITADPQTWGQESFAEPFLLSNDGRYLAAVPWAVLGRLVIFDAVDWSIKRKFEWNSVDPATSNLFHIINAISFSHDAELVAVGSSYGAIMICSISTGNCQILANGPAGEITSLAFTPNNKLLIVASRTSGGVAPPADSRMVIEKSRVHLHGWDVESGKLLISALPDDLGVHFLSVDSSGRFFAVSYRDLPGIGIYEVKTFNKISIIETLKPSWALSFSPDGTMLAASDEGHAIIFDVLQHK